MSRLHTKVVLTHQVVAENNLSSLAPLGQMGTNFVPTDCIYYMAALVPFPLPLFAKGQASSEFWDLL